MHAATKLIKIYFQTVSSIPVPLVPFLIFQITELSHVSHYIYIYIYWRNRKPLSCFHRVLEMWKVWRAKLRVSVSTFWMRVHIKLNLISGLISVPVTGIEPVAFWLSVGLKWRAKVTMSTVSTAYLGLWNPYYYIFVNVVVCKLCRYMFPALCFLVLPNFHCKCFNNSN